MINTCSRKYPGLEFLEAEASDLSALEGSSFDAVVCAFSGLDYVMEEARGRCIKECRRVLKPDGALLFSSHKPRSILVRPVWNRERVRKAVQPMAAPDSFTGKAAFLGVGRCGRSTSVYSSRVGQCKSDTCQSHNSHLLAWGRIYADSAHGGLMTHCWVPGRVVAEMPEQQFRLLKVLGDDYPRENHEYVTEWYYYVFSRANFTADGETCA
jgi:SAM-dependent methyltransferase